jgi:hypothetical protein
MQQIPLIASATLHYRGALIRPGERFRTSALEAASLIYRHVARFETVEVQPEASPVPEPPMPVMSRRRRYRRRDLRPDD